MSIRVILDEREFRDLVAGRVVVPIAQPLMSGQVIEVALADIGFMRMQGIIRDAQREQTPREETE